MSVRDRSQMDGSGGMIGWNITFEDWYAIELKALKKYFQYRNFDKGGTGALFLPNTMKIKLLIIKLSLKAWVLKLGDKAISSTRKSDREW